MYGAELTASFLLGLISLKGVHFKLLKKVLSNLLEPIPLDMWTKLWFFHDEAQFDKDEFLFTYVKDQIYKAPVTITKGLKNRWNVTKCKLTFCRSTTILPSLGWRTLRVFTSESWDHFQIISCIFWLKLKIHLYQYINLLCLVFTFFSLIGWK